MNVCIIGDGLTSLSLAKNLINKKINVHIYDDRKNDKSLPTRTIGISKNNIEFFKKEICKFPNKDIWKIKQIEIYSEKLKDENVLNFVDNKKNLFYMIKNDKLYSYLNKELLKNKFFKKINNQKKMIFIKKIIKKNKYDLIINCEKNNFITKKYFSKKNF